MNKLLICEHFLVETKLYGEGKSTARLNGVEGNRVRSRVVPVTRATTCVRDNEARDDTLTIVNLKYFKISIFQNIELLK